MRNFIIAWKCVAGHMDSCTLCVGKVTSLFELIVIKFCGAERIPNIFPARKTASAPKFKADLRQSISPAGDKISGFSKLVIIAFNILQICVLLFKC